MRRHAYTTITLHGQGKAAAGTLAVGTLDSITFSLSLFVLCLACYQLEYFCYHFNPFPALFPVLFVASTALLSRSSLDSGSSEESAELHRDVRSASMLTGQEGDVFPAAGGTQPARSTGAVAARRVTASPVQTLARLAAAWPVPPSATRCITVLAVQAGRAEALPGVVVARVLSTLTLLLALLPKLPWGTGLAASLAGVARGAAALACLVVTRGAVLTVAHAHAGRPVEALRTV